MIGKTIRTVIAGILAGMVVSTVVTSGVFDEAQQAKEASTAWCAGSC